MSFHGQFPDVLSRCAQLNWKFRMNGDGMNCAPRNSSTTWNNITNARLPLLVGSPIDGTGGIHFQSQAWVTLSKLLHQHFCPLTPAQPKLNTYSQTLVVFKASKDATSPTKTSKTWASCATTMPAIFWNNRASQCIANMATCTLTTLPESMPISLPILRPTSLGHLPLLAKNPLIRLRCLYGQNNHTTNTTV